MESVSHDCYLTPLSLIIIVFVSQFKLWNFQTVEFLPSQTTCVDTINPLTSLSHTYTHTTGTVHNAGREKSLITRTHTHTPQRGLEDFRRQQTGTSTAPLWVCHCDDSLMCATKFNIKLHPLYSGPSHKYQV